MIRYRINVLEELQKRGYSTTKLKESGILPMQTILNIKAGKMVNAQTLNKLCILLHMQPGDILEVIPTDEEKIKYY